MIRAMATPFSILILFGVILGLGWCSLRVSPKEALRVVDHGLLALLGALAGGRIGYVVGNWAYFQNHFAETWQVWLGGLSGVGAAYGFVLAIAGIAAISGRSLAALADQLYPLGLSLGVVAWLASWWAGSAYGIQAANLPIAAWFTLPAQDESGAWTLRFPTPLIGALLTLALGASLDRLSRRAPSQKPLPSGKRAVWALIGFGAILFGLSFTRVDPTIYWHGWRLDAWAGLGFVVLGSLAGLLMRPGALQHHLPKL